MLSRIVNEARTFKIAKPVDIGDDIVLPAGRYAGCAEWVETRMPAGNLRKTKAVWRIRLQANDIRRFGGDVSAHTREMSFDISTQVRDGRVL
ncbi:hypothetical protein [Aureimonas psammosilenae]|uniref:hypothetical protein n=1 Tax=Aureimonas psammosilenae TaxID=2495496 RepID=UPI0012610A0E|nr:hypothetical protein [Aureimonas psammosilenae]